MPYSEADTRANYIDPALVQKGWEARPDSPDQEL